MTVKELIDALNLLPANTEIIVSSDGEGNSFSPLRSVSAGLYVAENKWSGNFYSENEIKEAGEHATLVVAMWPTN